MKKFIIIPRIGNAYRVSLNLPKVFHKFKFKINDIYYTNNNYPIINEGDNSCNHIDTFNNKPSPIKSHNNNDYKNSDRWSIW